MFFKGFMIFTGLESTSGGSFSWNGEWKKTEIIDLINKKTCSPLADVPDTIVTNDAVGVNLQGTPVFCGGVLAGKISDRCYKFTNGSWKEFTNMKQERRDAAGIMYKKEWHIFGGQKDTSLYSNTSEIISQDGEVKKGPDLPTGFTDHAITSYNEKVSILSGGNRHKDSLTWYYDHKTGEFTSGPKLRRARRYHASATLVDKVTNEKIPVVAGGFGGFGKSEPYPTQQSTEILINGEWQIGI
jgi:hypothetical protein